MGNHGGGTGGTNRDDSLYFVLFQPVYDLFLALEPIHDAHFFRCGHQWNGFVAGFMDSLFEHAGGLSGLGRGVCDELGCGPHRESADVHYQRVVYQRLRVRHVIVGFRFATADGDIAQTSFVHRYTFIGSAFDGVADNSSLSVCKSGFLDVL